MRPRQRLDASVTICFVLFCLATALAISAACFLSLSSVSLFAYPLLWVLMYGALSLAKVESTRKKQVLTIAGFCFATALILAKLIHAFTGNITPALLSYAVLWLVLLALLTATARRQAA
ncbi:hypothetical protein KIMH_07810 [Bombiscardovia apis]|uniref:Uncharacterized protein n=1 Tax=Bombiscardovia apis TaxID=2932182 RepID=A0ABN6SJ37_9BIFI|nr:hypothetical protein [Bombiscardovia apis]BDR54670.1 hypothetical protein KIMH_07810 [Bombiscardovia apis]